MCAGKFRFSAAPGAKFSACRLVTKSSNMRLVWAKALGPMPLRRFFMYLVSSLSISRAFSVVQIT